MLRTFTQYVHKWLFAAPRRWLHNTRLWRLTSHTERLVVFSLLSCVSLFVYFAARHTLASKLLDEELQCLAMNVYHEARGEPLAGQYAVAEVTLNRVRSNEFPDRVCDVVHQQHWDPQRQQSSRAFSWTAMEVQVDYDSDAWQRAVQIADEVLHPQRNPTLYGVLYYHTIDVRPGWAKKRKQLARIGRHVFYQ